jgi:hypothetical protein
VILEAEPGGRIFCTECSDTFSEAMAGDRGDLEPGQWKVGDQSEEGDQKVPRK